MRIFELAWDFDAFEKSIDPEIERAGIDPNTLGNTLASVDRRFRRIALSTPILWSIVTSKKSMDVRAANLARSKVVGIHVYLFYSNNFANRGKIFSQLLIHSLRWKSLFIGFDWAAYYRLLLETQNLKLPLLRSLMINGLSDNEEPCGSYVNWYMPKLACLRLHDKVLTPSFS